MTDPATTTRLRQAFGWGRAVVGAILSVDPGRAGAAWYGHQPTRTTQMALRSMGARDLAIGVGTALATGDSARSWLLAGAIADAADAATVVIGRGVVKRANMIAFGSGALAFAVLGAWLSRRP